MVRIINFSRIKITIFQKLLIGIIAVLMLISIIAVVGISSVNYIEKSSKIMLKESKQQFALQKLKLNFQQLLMPPNDYLIHGDKIEFVNFVLLDSIANAQIIECKEYSETHFGEKFFNNLESDFKKIEALSLEIFKLENPIGNPDGSIMMEEMDTISNKAINEISELLLIESLEMEQYVNTNQATNIMATRFIIIVGLIITISLVVGGFFYVNEIVTPIKNLSQTAQKVSLGDLSAKSDITTSTRDEINDFTKSFNNMIGVLEQTTVSRDYFNNILNRMIDTLIITDSTGKIKIVNQAAINLLEYTEEEIIGQPINKILSSKNGNEVVRTNDISKILMEKPVQNVYNKYYTKSDKEIPVSFSKSFMYDDENKIMGMIFMAFHKTKDVQTEQLPKEDNSRNEAKNIKTLGEIPLTNRELEVIKLIILELSNREIAEKLFISVRTVETHRKNIMQKLHAKSVISLVLYSAQNGII